MFKGSWIVTGGMEMVCMREILGGQSQLVEVDRSFKDQGMVMVNWGNICGTYIFVYLKHLLMEMHKRSSVKQPINKYT